MNNKNKEIIKNACKSSLKFLCKEILKYWDWCDFHNEIVALLERKSNRKLILVPRDHLKSAIITKAWVIQQLLRNPNKRILISHGVQSKSEEILREIKEYLTTKSVLPLYFGDFMGDTWKTNEIIIKQRTKAFSAASISATGMGAESTSSHYDVIVLDDLQTKENSQTPELREKVKAYYRSMLDLLERDGILIVVGTRWDVDDYYADILKYEKSYYDVIIKKVKEGGKIIYPRKFNLKWHPTDKYWINAIEPTDEYIEYLKDVKGSDYWGQYENNPIDLSNQLFKRSYFKYWQKRPDSLYIALTCDPAISTKEHADESALVVAGMDNEHKIHVLDLLHGHWTPNQFIDNIFNFVYKWNPMTVGLETTGMQLIYQYSLEEEMRKRNKYFSITELKHTSRDRKNMRIKALEPVWRSGHLLHAPWMGTLEDQALTFNPTKDNKRDDILDALAMQLEVLMPADKVINTELNPDSWAAHAYRVRKSKQPYKQFFKS